MYSLAFLSSGWTFSLSIIFLLRDAPYPNQPPLVSLPWLTLWCHFHWASWVVQMLLSIAVTPCPSALHFWTSLICDLNKGRKPTISLPILTYTFLKGNKYGESSTDPAGMSFKIFQHEDEENKAVPDSIHKEIKGRRSPGNRGESSAEFW